MLIYKNLNFFISFLCIFKVTTKYTIIIFIYLIIRAKICRIFSTKHSAWKSVYVRSYYNIKNTFKFLYNFYEHEFILFSSILIARQ